MPAAGGRATALGLDVRDRTAVDAAVDGAVREFGRLDVIEDCVGVSQSAGFRDIEPSDWDRIIAIYLTGMFNLRQAAARQMDNRARNLESKHECRFKPPSLGLAHRDRQMVGRREWVRRPYLATGGSSALILIRLLIRPKSLPCHGLRETWPRPWPPSSPSPLSSLPLSSLPSGGSPGQVFGPSDLRRD